MNKKMYIYYLTYSDSNDVYIGRTINPHQRLVAHQIKEDKNENGCVIKIHILEKVNVFYVGFWETFYMDLFKMWGFNIRNKENGTNMYVSFKMLKTKLIKYKEL